MNVCDWARECNTLYHVKMQTMDTPFLSSHEEIHYEGKKEEGEKKNTETQEEKQQEKKRKTEGGRKNTDAGPVSKPSHNVSALLVCGHRKSISEEFGFCFWKGGVSCISILASMPALAASNDTSLGPGDDIRLIETGIQLVGSCLL